MKKHARCDKHNNNIRAVSKTTRINEITKFTQYNTTEFKRKEAEIRLALFITEHNIPLRTADHLVQLIKTINLDSEVILRRSMSYND